MTGFTYLRRMLVPIGLAMFALTTSLAAPAYADTVTTQRSATVEWLQTGQISGVGGNVHVGRAQFWVPAGSPTPVTLYGEMFDYSCPDGFLPDGLWLDAISQLDSWRLPPASGAASENSPRVMNDGDSRNALMISCTA